MGLFLHIAKTQSIKFAKEKQNKKQWKTQLQTLDPLSNYMLGTKKIGGSPLREETITSDSVLELFLNKTLDEMKTKIKNT